jgi:hypothetical protein
MDRLEFWRLVVNILPQGGIPETEGNVRKLPSDIVEILSRLQQSGELESTLVRVRRRLSLKRALAQQFAGFMREEFKPLFESMGRDASRATQSTFTEGQNDSRAFAQTN